MSTNEHITTTDVLRMFDLGLDTETIAKVMKVPESSVYNLLAFAKSVERNFGSGAQIVRTATKREQHLEAGSGRNLSLFPLSELEGGDLQGNNAANGEQKAR